MNQTYRFRTATPTRTPTPVNIGNKIWHDLNANGLQDAGEPGIGNVVVQLWNPAGNQLLNETLTDGNGIYTLVAPFPAAYRVRVLRPSTASNFTTMDVGADDTDDSDIRRCAGSPLSCLLVTFIGFTEVFTIGSNVISTTIFDAGLLNVSQTPTAAPTSTATPTVIPTSTPVPTAIPTPVPEFLVLLPMVSR